ncbi:MAG: FAD-binding oxidoreductase [Anaerolineaceae bacterium]|nr:FAD-binding oxidoreductase [Anaerolineaceae bacterium]
MNAAYDRIIIGAGIYGLYAALFCCRRGEKVLVLECDGGAFKRATTINQARVHQGYHYPRSLSTALKSAGYFERFNRDYDFCINREFDQIYAISNQFSWTNGKQFQQFCRAAGIPCEELNSEHFFKPGMCDGAYRTREYTYDAEILKNYFLKELADHPDKAEIKYNARISTIDRIQDSWQITTSSGEKYQAAFVLNAAYASINQVSALAGFEPFRIKYELCEIILCSVNEKLKSTGLTVMDGPFFSIMPFGMSGLHSLTSVTFTPHAACYDTVPRFSCQEKSNGSCSGKQFGNCNECSAKPVTAFPYMSGLARKYMRDDYNFDYVKSLFSIKPILMSSEIDDSRPTVIRIFSKQPTFAAVLSGKVNTIYDLDEILTMS